LDNKKHNLFTDGLYIFFLKTTMQNLLSETINVAGQTNNNTVITALCAHVLNAHNTTWPEVQAAATDIFLSRLNFPALPDASLTPATLADFVESVAAVMPEPEDDSAIDLVEPQQQRRHRDEEEDEEDDSVVVPDDVIEFDGSESSSSSSFEPEKKTRRRR
jgi:hypothetical protein